MADTVSSFQVWDEQGRAVTVGDLLKPVTLIVNIDCKVGGNANSECKELQDLYLRHKPQGFEILAFPCDQFQIVSDQGHHVSAIDVKADLAKRYNVTFPIMHKIKVNGDDADPLFMFLQKRLSGFPTNAIKWDFTKFLIVNGEPTKRYSPTTSPHSIEGEIMHAFDTVRSSGVSQPLQRSSEPRSNISDSSQIPQTSSLSSSLPQSQQQDTSRLQRTSNISTPSSDRSKDLDTSSSGLQVSEPEIREYDVQDPDSGTQAHVVASRTEAVGSVPLSGETQQSLRGQPFVHVKSVESVIIGQPRDRDRDTEDQSSKWSSQSVQGSQPSGGLSESSGISGEGAQQQQRSSDLGGSNRDWNAPASQQWETPAQSSELWSEDSKKNQPQQQQQQQQPTQWRQSDIGSQRNVPEPGANLEYTHQGTHLRSGQQESYVSEHSPFVQGTATGSHVMGVKPASHFHGNDPTYTDKHK